MKQLLNGYVLVKKPTETKTEGLQVAQALDSFIYTGEVVQVDEVSQCTLDDNHPYRIRVGDIVTFLKHAGEAIPVNGEDMKFIQIKDIIAIK